MIDFKKVYQAVNRSSNTDSMSISNNYSMPQNVFDLEDLKKSEERLKVSLQFNITHKYTFEIFHFLKEILWIKKFLMPYQFNS